MRRAFTTACVDVSAASDAAAREGSPRQASCSRASQCCKLCSPRGSLSSASRLASCAQACSAARKAWPLGRASRSRQWASSVTRQSPLALVVTAHFSQSSRSSSFAAGAAARSKLMTCAAAGVVDKRQPVSSLITSDSRCSKARTRRTSNLSSATRATGVRPASTASMTVAAAAWASRSRSSHNQRCGMTKPGTCTCAVKGSSALGSASNISAAPCACASRPSVKASAPPIRNAIHADGRRVKTTSVLCVQFCEPPCMAHSRAVSANAFSNASAGAEANSATRAWLQ